MRGVLSEADVERATERPRGQPAGGGSLAPPRGRAGVGDRQEVHVRRPVRQNLRGFGRPTTTATAKSPAAPRPPEVDDLLQSRGFT